MKKGIKIGISLLIIFVVMYVTIGIPFYTPSVIHKFTCIGLQSFTKATNVLTGSVDYFPTSCDIPLGYKMNIPQ